MFRQRRLNFCVFFSQVKKTDILWDENWQKHGIWASHQKLYFLDILLLFNKKKIYENSYKSSFSWIFAGTLCFHCRILGQDLVPRSFHQLEPPASSQPSFTFLETLALPLCQHSSQMVAFHKKMSPGKRDIQTIWRGDNGNVYIYWRGFPGC